MDLNNSQDLNLRPVSQRLFYIEAHVMLFVYHVQ